MRKLDFAVSVDEIFRHQEKGVASVEGRGAARHDTIQRRPRCIRGFLLALWLPAERLMIEQCFEGMYHHLYVFCLLPNYVSLSARSRVKCFRRLIPDPLSSIPIKDIEDSYSYHVGTRIARSNHNISHFLPDIACNPLIRHHVPSKSSSKLKRRK
jgi:hypothetical protein